MSAKAVILRLLGDLALKQAVVTSIEYFGSHFVWIQVQGTREQAASYQPGDKIQLLLPMDEVRTYTPIGWDADGQTSLLVYVRGGSPASQWAEQVRIGDPLRFLGPERSLPLPEGPLSMIGDETSIAVAAAYQLARPESVACAFESDVDLSAVTKKLGLRPAMVLPREVGLGHCVDLAQWARERHHASGARVGLTGGPTLLKTLRGKLREAQVPVKTRAYWAPGKTGLD